MLPSDKERLVIGLKQMGEFVSATGEGINDAGALKAAHVGFAMGEGCSAAKDASDMILINNDFQATVKAVLWGRNIYQNVKRFIQFQMTANFACLSLVLVSSLIYGEPPMNPVQLLWLNMVMDTFAAIALATERPQTKIIVEQRPIKLTDAVLSPEIWRQILGVSIYMFCVLMMMVFAGRSFWDNMDYNKTTPVMCTGTADPKVGCGKGEIISNKGVHYTIIFNTFMFMQYFNEINCRRVGQDEINVFRGFFSNLYFVVVVIASMAAQYFSTVYVGTNIFLKTRITSQQNGAAILFGALVLVISPLLKMTPKKWVEKVDLISIDETAKPEEDFTSGILSATQGKTSEMIKRKENAADDVDGAHDYQPLPDGEKL